MSYFINDLLNYKNPISLAKFCKQNTIANDLYGNSNSILWESLINYYFKNYSKYKLRKINFKDYYVYLWD